MNKLVVIPIFALFFLLIDWYAFQAVRTATQSVSETWRTVFHTIYWTISGLTIAGLFVYNFADPDWLGRKMRMAIMVGIFTNFLSKFILLIFLILDEIWRLIQWIIQQFSSRPEGTETVGDAVTPATNTITRSQFLAKAGLITATVPLIGVSYGIISGAHDYRVRRRTVYLPHLPKAFDGLRIGQLSDIHSGSFWNRTAVKGGVELMRKEKPDVIFFTGDLVNNEAGEMRDYVDVFGKIEAPLGVYSTLGNHDYGDYVQWASPQAKQQNLQKLMDTHKAMGWDILMNEHRILTQGDAQIAILGIENWGAKANFPKYGKMAEAYAGTENIPVKLLLSHDPSHWMAEVIPLYPDIDLTFSGHTHGMQLGVEIGDFRWSPVKYVYEQWADLYQSGEQYLYVNRGFGYLGFPGRIGIAPEITILELKRA